MVKNNNTKTHTTNTIHLLCTLSIIFFKDVRIDVLLYFLDTKKTIKNTKNTIKNTFFEKNENIFTKCISSIKIAITVY